MIIYIHKKCSTCQKALQFLEKIPLSEDLIVKDIVTMPPSLEELNAMLNYQKGHLKKLINTSGQLYRELKLNEKLEGMTLDEVLSLLAINGMLIKRPFLLGKDFGFTGFNEAEWSKKIH